MSADKQPIIVVTGMKEEIYEYDWKIRNLSMVQKDESVLESQSFEIDTGVGTPLQSKWIAGLRKILDKKKHYTVYCKLLQILSNTEVKKLATHFTIVLKRSNGTLYWTIENQGRIKINEGFDLEERGYTYNDNSNWAGLQDELGTVTFSIKLKILKQIFPDKSAKAIEQQFQLKSVKMAQINLSSFMSLESTEFDVKILCSDEKTVRCNKAVLTAKSSVFETMLRANLSEAKTGFIEVKDVSSKTIKLMIQYLYTGELPKSWRDPDIIAEFTYAAGKYQLTELLEHLDNMIGNTNEDPRTLLALLELTGKMSLKKAEAQLMDRIFKLTISAKSGSEILSIFSTRN